MLIVCKVLILLTNNFFANADSDFCYILFNSVLKLLLVTQEHYTLVYVNGKPGWPPPYVGIQYAISPN